MAEADRVRTGEDRRFHRNLRMVMRTKSSQNVATARVFRKSAIRWISAGGPSTSTARGADSPRWSSTAGAVCPGHSWLLVQPGVAKATRACWYDRAGYGWSDPAPSPHRAMPSRTICINCSRPPASILPMYS